MIARHNRGLRFRTVAAYKTADEKQAIINQLASMPTPAYAYENKHAPRMLVCDFKSEKDRDAFDRSLRQI